MGSTRSIPHHLPALLLHLLLALAVAACNGVSPTAPDPIAPDIPAYVPPLLPNGGPNFLGEATVVSVTGQSTCGYSPRQGDLEADHRWWVGTGANAFELTLDAVDGPIYSGTLQGRNFTDDFQMPGDYLAFVCQFRAAWISGVFSEDFSSFEADETQVFGPPDKEFKVVRRHRARHR